MGTDEKTGSRIEDVQSRLECLEKRFEDAHDFFKHTLTAITIIFIFVGLIITVLSISSKSEISDAIKEMQRRFEILSEQALKKPRIEIFYKDKPIGGKAIDVESESDESIVVSSGFYLKNLGDKAAENVFLSLFSTLLRILLGRTCF